MKTHFMKRFVKQYSHSTTCSHVIRFFVIFSFLVLFGNFSEQVRAEFYKYVNEDGEVVFVDDKSLIPDEYSQDVEVYKEKSDHLNEKDKKQKEESYRKLEEEKEEDHNKWVDGMIREEEERKAEERKKRELEKEELKKELETKIIIDKNRVLVPVILSYLDNEIETLLLLDTGASIVVLHKNVADQLGLESLQSSASQVAGGQIIKSDLAQLKQIRVGDLKIDQLNVLIIEHTGVPVAHSGLLGMNFLRHFDYSIDYDNQVIRWKF